MVFLRSAAPGDDFETRGIGAIGEPDAGRGIQKDEKGDCRGESQITAIITSRVKRPRLIRDLPEGGKARSAPDVVLGEQPVGIPEKKAPFQLGVDDVLGLDSSAMERRLGLEKRPFAFELERDVMVPALVVRGLSTQDEVIGVGGETSP